MIRKIKSQKKYLIYFGVSIIMIAMVGIISPLISTSLVTKKEKSFEEKISLLKTETQNVISKREATLVEHLSTLRNTTNSVSLYDNLGKEEIFDLVNGSEFSNIGVGIYDSTGQLIIWNNNHPLSNNQFKNFQKTFLNEKSFFYDSSLKIYLSVVSLNDDRAIYLSIPLEKHYQLRNEYFEPLNLSGQLSNKYNVDLKIVYQSRLTSNVDKIPKFSFDILNSKGNKIGYAYITNINVNEGIENLESITFLVQSIFAFTAFIFLGLWLFSLIDKTKYSFIRILLISIYILLFRAVLFLLDVPGKIGVAELNNPVYFSSTFGYGIVKSPMELFLTVITLITILFVIYKSVAAKGIKQIQKSSNNILATTEILFLSVLFFVILRIFGVTINSIVFDSTILYFKETLLFSDLPTTFMYLNVLLIGSGFVLLSVLLVLLLLRSVVRVSDKSPIQNLFFLFFFLQLFGIIFDLIQLDPQTNWFVRVVFILIALAIGYFIEFQKSSKNTVLLTILFAGSFLSISLLSYFNFDLEKRSLKTIATEMTRTSIDLLDYYADKIIYEVAQDDYVKQKLLNKSNDFNSEAFVIWSNSALSRDSKSSIINIIAPDKSLLGSFNYEFDEPFIWDWNDEKSDINEVRKVSQKIEGTENQIIRIITPIKHESKTLGFVEVSLLHDVYGFGIDQTEEFLSSSNPISKISINLDFLKIFEFKNQKLSYYYTDALISEPETEKILNAKFTENNEAWINLLLNGEGHTFYLNKDIYNGDEEIIAVGLRDKDVTWSLYNFFKVFFIHSIMILIILLIVAAANFSKIDELKISFRMKILLALLLVSVLPLILLANYFKEITEEKNSDAVYYKLGKRADNVNQYLDNYFYNSTLNEKSILDKAVNDLRIHFSIFEGENLIYSSEGVYYKIGLLSKTLNAEAYLNLFYKGEKEYVLNESIENYVYNTFFYKATIGDKVYVISVSDAFNRIQLPMTGTELNIFLFGTYSLAIILIILLSTLLANQISSPIEKLTKATKSVGSGDLDIQLQSSSKGEIKELIDGFNRMVRELKKNQVELAEVERESAWKEMAKQVAHEIKNPLTPMKLAVQHLISTYKDKSNKFDEIFNKVTSTLITQIENLTNIASEFSSFAKMPSIKLDDLDLVALVKETVDLFIDEQCKVELKADLNEATIRSDREQFQRMIINLIRNSIQADASNVVITIELSEGDIMIRVKDDGHGITDEILNKIFDENYTTKKEGMGLGLSLAKRFLDITNGIIYISETSPKGTEIIIKISQD
ncbi:MAG: ATP-binding protein [Bacteroidota bacterium]